MLVRSITYWFLCGVIAVGAAKAGVADTTTFMLPANASAIQVVPEPGRAVLLFAGIMAMAFTYRRAWLNWKRAS